LIKTIPDAEDARPLPKNEIVASEYVGNPHKSFEFDAEPGRTIPGPKFVLEELDEPITYKLSLYTVQANAFTSELICVVCALVYVLPRLAIVRV
jgi:hypothetical protein